MALDFSKIGTGSTVDTVLPPRDIFNALPSKKSKFQYPRDVQSQVWGKWFERRGENSLVIKMNTGSGKTVVGLILLKSCLNEGKSPAVYICPDKYLVQQVIDAANEIGIEVTNDTNSHRFLSGKAILISNIYKLVNGKSVFGVGDEGIKLKISSLVVDDAHACLETVEDQFTIKLPYNSDAYKEIFNILKESLHSECETKAIEIESGDPTSYMQVPYWVWQEKISEISRILVKNSNCSYLKFIWSLVKENLLLSHCVISSNTIEISPHSIPIHMIPSVFYADRKIFMTATLVDDSILSSHFGIEDKFIKNPVVPDSAGDIGDRMILLPQVINPETTLNEIKEYCKQISSTINVVVIVASQYQANHWKDDADLILNTNNLYEGIDKLKSEHVGLVILINRYDGIDLPGDACRLLVIDGFPDVRRQIDRVKQSMLMGATKQNNQVLQRIEQGMGRGVRSNDDYCVVLLIGRSLTNQLYSQGSINRLSPSTKEQLKLSEQVAEQIQGKSINEITDTINYCLYRNEDWVRESKGVLASLKYTTENKLDNIVINKRKAYDLASKNNYVASKEILLDLVNSENDKMHRGYLKQLLAEYINLTDKSEAQTTQLSATNDNRRVLKPIAGIQYHRIGGRAFDQAVVCSEYLKERHESPNKLIIEINGILNNLKFKKGTSNIFEEAMKNIARYIGFQSQRPEQEYKKCPDNLWNAGELKYFVIECKNEAVSSTINKAYCNQLNGSCTWFTNKYDTSCSYVPIMVHPSIMFEYAASPNTKIRIITEEKLEKFRIAVQEFIKSIANSNELSSPSKIRDKLISYKLRESDFIENYTSMFKVKS